MKKTFLLLIFFVCFYTMADAKVIECNTQEEIELEGNLSANKQKTLMKPITAFKDANFIQVDFLSNLGAIVIYLYDEEGNVVSQQSVNTYVGQQMYIDISLLSSGEYTIEFVNSQNKYLSGNFVVE